MLESLIDASLYINSSNDSEEEELPCYEKISENEDIYLIRTKHTSYELHRKRLIGTLKEKQLELYMKPTWINREHKF